MHIRLSRRKGWVRPKGSAGNELLTYFSMANMPLLFIQYEESTIIFIENRYFYLSDMCFH